MDIKKMKTTTRSQWLHAFAVNPWTVFGSLALGVLAGMLLPEAAPKFAFVGDIYVGLLKMTALPFMVAAVIFSLQRLMRDGSAVDLVGRVMVMFVGVSVFVVVVGAVVLLAMRPGEHLSNDTLRAFGAMVGSDGAASDTVMSLYGADPSERTAGFADMLIALVPGNFFAALANGDTLKALVFSLFFGFAAGRLPASASTALAQSLETVYFTCQKLMHWLAYPTPVVLFCMGAAHIGTSGIGPLEAMIRFVAAFLVVSAVLIGAAVVVIWKRSGRTLAATLAELRIPFALALATRSSMACMPGMIQCLVDGFGFARARVELLVPLTVSLLRVGPMVYYASATLFIAQLYERPLDAGELGLVLLASVLAGFASAGTSGLVTVSLAGMTCAYLHLPFEAAFVLFAAVDPVCEMLRTLLLVIGNSAVVSFICSRPSRS
ncbi:sodium:dicarboxylate symporter [Burkholderia ubonensis]|uniref:Sodium:dicarboxylate symporter n=2 Tax=Burkholderia ubonensis TaxID=101571 RepID=A0AAW3NGI6_9BURK|nr:sodium:dicarboxylate symporter [Burkholderia ubonensis]KVV44481.1 sodium:dicarboxylate symporter [Burkholderia ubonensis]KVW39806.1 sodium:dicarboxylate symporter [Burkholderia ubonensis]